MRRYSSGLFIGTYISSLLVADLSRPEGVCAPCSMHCANCSRLQHQSRLIFLESTSVGVGTVFDKCFLGLRCTSFKDSLSLLDGMWFLQAQFRVQVEFED